jgi:hypothetical protein
MKDKDVPPSSVLSLRKYVKNAVPPSADDDANDAAEDFRKARARSREALMLDVRFPDGTIESFDYSLPKRVTYKPDGTLILRFGQDHITVEGSNLHRVRQAVTEGRQKFIQEGTEAEDGIKPEDAAHIERIVFAEEEDR